MKWQRYLGPVVTIAAGLLVGFLVYVRVRDLQPSVPVAVAAADLAPGSVVGRDQVKVVLLPRMAVHPEARRSVGEVEGREVSLFVRAGEQLLESKFSGGSPGATGHVTLLYVPLPGQGYPGGFVRPGARVTLLVVEGRQEGELEVRVAAADVRVADVDRARGEGREPGRIVGLTVEVAEEEVADVAAALASGEVRVVRRWGGGPGTGMGVRP